MTRTPFVIAAPSTATTNGNGNGRHRAPEPPVITQAVLDAQHRAAERATQQLKDAMPWGGRPDASEAALRAASLDTDPGAFVQAVAKLDEVGRIPYIRPWLVLVSLRPREEWAGLLALSTRLKVWDFKTAKKHDDAEDRLITLVAERVEPQADTAVAATTERGASDDLAAGDIANASDLVAVYGHEFRHGGFCGWLHWDERRWERDATGVIVQRAKQVARKLLADLPDYLGDHAAVKRILSAQSAGRVHAMVSLAESEPPIPVRPGELDTDPWLLNVLNGTLDLRTGELRAHRPEDLITKLAPVTFNRDATCPRWERCLREIFSKDAELIAFVQRFVGHCLTGDVREDVFTIWHGAGGNGKTTIKEILLALFGDYAVTTPATTFLEKKGDHIPNDLARLQGARLVVAVEPEQGAKLATAMIKAMTGRDRMDARFLHREWFSFPVAFKPILIANKRPTINETTHAMWRRVRLVPFEVTFQGPAADTQLGAALLGELPGILNWALAGCTAWQRDGLGGAAKITAATEQYRVESDWFAGFLVGCCDIGAQWEEDAGALYRCYTAWAERSGTRVVSMTTFGTRESNSRTYRLGLRLPEGAPGAIVRAARP
jgi:P4 family phage/plasmid primase-like protien